MKLSIDKYQLTLALAAVAKGMSSRTTMPILSGILLSASGGNLTLRTSDLEISIQHTTAALVEDSGETVVPGKLFQEVVRALPDAAVSLELTDEGLLVACDESKFSIHTFNPIDFPSFPKVESQRRITIPAGRLAGAVKKVSKAVSRDESRATLTGVLLKNEGQKLTFAATDSYRLALVSEIEGSEEDFELLIPGAVLDEVVKLAGGETEIEIGEAENQIVFTFAETIFISRKIEGSFPNYGTLIPKDHQIKAVIETQALLTAIKRVSIAGQGRSPIRLNFQVDTQKIEIDSKTADLASASETIEAEIEGEDLVIGFNQQYITDGLSVVEDQEVLFEGQSPTKPGILKSGQNESSLYLTMPVRIEN